MAWGKMHLNEVLINREDRYKPTDKAIDNLKRIDKINFSGEIFMSDKSSNTDMIIVKKGDLVISGINVEKGAVAVYEGNEDITATIHYSSYEVNKNRIDIDFLKMFLKSPDFIESLKRQVPGGIKTEIKPKHILSLEVHFPIELIEQKRIAAHFFDKKEKLNKLEVGIFFQLAQIRHLNQAILEEAVRGRLVEQNPKDESANELLNRIQSIKEKAEKKGKTLSPIKPEQIPFIIPKTWKWCRLGDICSLITSGSRNWNRYYSSNGSLFIRSQNIKSGKIDMARRAYVTLPESTEGKRTEVERDDILMTITGAGVSNCGIIKEKDFTEGYVSQHVALLRLVEPRSAEWILFSILSESVGQAQFSKLIYGDKPGLNLDQINHLIVPFPPLNEQRLIVAEIERQLAKTEQLKEQALAGKQSAENLLAALLHDSFQAKTFSKIHPTDIKIASTNDQKIWQRQLVAMYVKTLREQPEDMLQGEMGLAKYTYLADMFAGANSGFHFLEHNYGPYTLEINDCLTNSGDVFKRKEVGTRKFEVFDLGKRAPKLINFDNPKLQEIKRGFEKIVAAFRPFARKDRTRQLELVASVCWLIDKLQTLNLASLYEGMRSWKTPKRHVKNKAELFNKNEVSEAIEFIKSQQWQLKLLQNC